MRLDLGVPIEGMRDTIRVITLSEAVDNSARLLRDAEVAHKLRESRDADAIYSVLALPPASAA